jgi:hypothetical protein
VVTVLVVVVGSAMVVVALVEVVEVVVAIEVVVVVNMLPKKLHAALFGSHLVPGRQEMGEFALEPAEV